MNSIVDQIGINIIIVVRLDISVVMGQSASTMTLKIGDTHRPTMLG